MALNTHVFLTLVALAAGHAACLDGTCAKRNDIDDTVSMLQADMLVNRGTHASSSEAALDLSSKAAPEVREATKSGPASLAESTFHEMLNLTQKVSCIENTGGTCLVEDCAKFRGPTTCDVGRCFCKKGYCSTVQGKCMKTQNEHIGGVIRLRNARYPKHYMYISDLGIVNSGLYVDDELNDRNDFKVYKPPGQGNSGIPAELLLASDKWKEYVATVTQSTETNGNGPSTVKWRTSAVPINVIGVSKPVEELVLNMFEAPKYDGAPNGSQSVMIASFHYTNRIFTVGDFSWDVSAADGDQGAGSYWLIEPPLPMKFTPYRGKLCSYDCGSYGSGRSNTSHLMIGFGIGGLVLFCLCGIGVAIYVYRQQSSPGDA